MSDKESPLIEQARDLGPSPRGWGELPLTNVHDRPELNRTLRRLDTIRDYILNGKEPEA